MKILIVGTPRSGSTYLFNVLSMYVLGDMVLNSMRYQEFLMDEPFTNRNYSEQKKIFDDLSRMESWVVKIHASQIDNINHRWITKLYKQADIIVKLTRNDFPAQVRSMCVTETLNDWGEHHVKNIYINKQVFVESFWNCYYSRAALNSIPYNVVIDYSELTTPQDIFYNVTGIYADELKFANLLPNKNTSSIKNIDEVRQWMQELKTSVLDMRHKI